MQLEVVTCSGFAAGVYFWGYKNLYSGKPFVGIEKEGSLYRMDLIALAKALDYFLYGTHKKGTIYVNSAGVLNKVHNLDTNKKSKNIDILDIIELKIKKIEEAGKTLNIFKSDNGMDVTNIKKAFIKLKYPKNDSKRYKKKNKWRLRPLY